MQGVPEKIAQSLSTTILQPYVKLFSFFKKLWSKCSERNYLADNSKCM